MIERVLKKTSVLISQKGQITYPSLSNNIVQINGVSKQKKRKKKWKPFPKLCIKSIRTCLLFSRSTTGTDYTGNLCKNGRKMDTNINHNKPVILIAEDEESNFLLLQAILKKLYSLVWVTNGRDAIEIARKQKIDLILLDIKMPIMDGITALNEIRKINKTIPILMQSAHVFSSDQEEAEKAGCSGFITKPINPLLLKEEIKKCLNNNSSPSL